MKTTLFLLILVASLLPAATTQATKISAQPLIELTQNSSIVALVHIFKSDISTLTYEKAHSAEKKYYIHFMADITESIVGKHKSKIIDFVSREPLLVDRDYLIILEYSESENLVVSQAGYAAFEKSYISFDSGVKEGIRVPVNYISIPDSLPYKMGVTQVNEYSTYKWLDWNETKFWLLSTLATQGQK